MLLVVDVCCCWNWIYWVYIVVVGFGFTFSDLFVFLNSGENMIMSYNAYPCVHRNAWYLTRYFIHLLCLSRLLFIIRTHIRTSSL